MNVSPEECEQFWDRYVRPRVGAKHWVWDGGNAPQENSGGIHTRRNRGGRKDTTYTAAFDARKGQVRVGLWINPGRPADHALFDSLKTKQSQIKRGIRAPLEWNDTPKKRRTIYLTRVATADTDNPAATLKAGNPVALADLADWIVGQWELFGRVFGAQDPNLYPADSDEPKP